MFTLYVRVSQESGYNERPFSEEAEPGDWGGAHSMLTRALQKFQVSHITIVLNVLVNMY